MDRQPQTILWVEDNRDTLVAVARLLHIRGHVVRMANSLAEAQQLIENHRFNVLITDVSLSDGSGLDLPALIRERNPTVCCVAVSGRGLPDDIARGLAAGFDHYLVKPFAIESLDELLRRRETVA